MVSQLTATEAYRSYMEQHNQSSNPVVPELKLQKTVQFYPGVSAQLTEYYVDLPFHLRFPSKNIYYVLNSTGQTMELWVSFKDIPPVFVAEVDLQLTSEEVAVLQPEHSVKERGKVLVGVYLRGNACPFVSRTAAVLNPNGEESCGVVKPHSFFDDKDAVITCQRPQYHYGKHVNTDTSKPATHTWSEEGSMTQPYVMWGYATLCRICSTALMNTQSGLCEQCSFWASQMESPGMVYQGKHYRWGNSHGFGGATFTVDHLNESGEVVRTETQSGLWAQGTIPRAFLMPDNCVIREFS